MTKFCRWSEIWSMSKQPRRQSRATRSWRAGVMGHSRERTKVTRALHKTKKWNYREVWKRIMINWGVCTLLTALIKINLALIKKWPTLGLSSRTHQSWTVSSSLILWKTNSQVRTLTTTSSNSRCKLTGHCSVGSYGLFLYLAFLAPSFIL